MAIAEIEACSGGGGSSLPYVIDYKNTNTTSGTFSFSYTAEVSGYYYLLFSGRKEANSRPTFVITTTGQVVQHDENDTTTRTGCGRSDVLCVELSEGDTLSVTSDTSGYGYVFFFADNKKYTTEHIESMGDGSTSYTINASNTKVYFTTAQGRNAASTSVSGSGYIGNNVYGIVVDGSLTISGTCNNWGNVGIIVLA